MNKYVNCSEFRNLSCDPELTNIDYSDDFECKLYERIRRATDRSTLSIELLPLIVDWPSEYHISSGRHCLLRPLGIEPATNALELGCGCGAVTRYLGELGALVTAVEGSYETNSCGAKI
jgi:hypothetical protein